ncbi:MAG: nucleotidyltransferase family protein [Chitinophagales bacterium]|nr:nucleotidyltransferase family protein [Chitinophagales bacterium]
MNKIHQYKLMLKNEMPYLRDHYHVKEAGVFGSNVRGEEQKKSDLNVLITFNRLTSLLMYANLENYLSDKLKVKVDLVMKSGLKKKIRPFVLKDLVSI